METAETEFHQCSSCNRYVPQHEPRYHCMSCVNYDLCASCQRDAQPSRGHTEGHVVYQRIQVGVSSPNGFPLVADPTAPQYPGSPHPFWDRMITENKRPSDRFKRLIDSIHNSISLTREPRSGDFEPEKASYIMALLCYPEQDNIFYLFQNSSTQNPHGLAWSDYQTLLIYRQCGWDYQEGTRNLEQQIRSVPEEHRETFRPVEHGMPLLTRTGLRDMIVTEALANPQDFCQRFNHLLSVINGPQTALIDLEDRYRFPAGPIGSDCWPMSPDREAVATRSMMQETARAAIEINRHLYGHM